LCEAPECRKIIRGTDYLQPFVDRYEGHVSDYVRQKRSALIPGFPKDTEKLPTGNISPPRSV
jgi:hypothetical protein